MSELLAIVGPAAEDEALIEQLSRGRPGRVTVLVQNENVERDWAWDDSDAGRALRDRLATLLHAIEARTGAAVVGAVGDAEELMGWRFDRVVRAVEFVAA